jgi:phosphatidylserine decarboxylase
MLPFAPDAWSVLWKLAAAAIVCEVLGWTGLGWIFVLLGGFSLFFFRDPDRTVPLDPSLVVAPADGKVLRIEPIPEDEFTGGPAIRIAIFLSVFNVHINRSPISGTVLFQKYRAGKMLPAFQSHASEENERNTLGIEGQRIRVQVHQITGLIARRIVCRVAPGDRLLQGQRFGLIKFGSCTELILPAALEVLVRAGDRVKAGETAVARIPRDGE